MNNFDKIIETENLKKQKCFIKFYFESLGGNEFTTSVSLFPNSNEHDRKTMGNPGVYLINQKESLVAKGLKKQDC